MDLALVVLGILAFIGFLAWTRSNNRRAQRQLVLDRQRLLLEKVGSGPALNEFLASPEGTRFLEQLQEPKQPGSNAKHSIASTITTGMVSMSAGIALILAVNYLGFSADWWVLFTLGFLGICVGVGLLIAAAITYRLSKKWGLLKDDV